MCECLTVCSLQNICPNYTPTSRVPIVAPPWPKFNNILCLFHFRHSGRWVVVLYWSFNLHFLMTNKVGHLFVCLFGSLFWSAYSCLLLFSFWVVCLFLLTRLCNLDIGLLQNRHNAKISLSRACCSSLLWCLLVKRNSYLAQFIQFILYG